MYVLTRLRAASISARPRPEKDFRLLEIRSTANKYRSQKGRGFTFIELSVSLALILAAISPAVYFFTKGINISKETEVITQCLILAQDLMEEILSKNFEETSGSFGRETGESTANRANYDDVDDYDGWGPGNSPEYIDGTQMNGSGSTPDYWYLRRNVIVQNVANTNFNTVVADGSSDFKKIRVSVSTLANYIVSVTRTLEVVVSKH